MFTVNLVFYLSKVSKSSIDLLGWG